MWVATNQITLYLGLFCFQVIWSVEFEKVSPTFAKWRRSGHYAEGGQPNQAPLDKKHLHNIWCLQKKQKNAAKVEIHETSTGKFKPGNLTGLPPRGG